MPEAVQSADTEEAMKEKRYHVALDDNEQSIQMSAFRMEKTPSGKITYNGTPGYHDDCIMAFAISLYILPQAISYDEQIATTNIFEEDYTRQSVAHCIRTGAGRQQPCAPSRYSG